MLQSVKWVGDAIGAAIERMVVDRGDVDGAIPHLISNKAPQAMEAAAPTA